MKNCNQCGGKCVFPDGRVCLANQLAAERERADELAGRLRAVAAIAAGDVPPEIEVQGHSVKIGWDQAMIELRHALDGPVPKCEGCEAAAEAKGEKE